MTEEEWKTAKNVLSMLFKHAAADVAGLTEIVEKINDDAIDIRQLMKSTSEGTTHPKTKDLIIAIIENYDNSLFRLSSCAGEAQSLISLFSGANYQERLELARARTTPDHINRDALNKLLISTSKLDVRMVSRHLYWSGFLINFANLVRGIDSAQAILLKRPSWLERYKGIAKEGVSFVAGQAVPVFGLLIALAESQD